MDNKSNLYQLNGKVPLMQAIPFGLQHVLAMFVSNITPIIILANVVGIDPALSAMLIQNCMIIVALSLSRGSWFHTSHRHVLHLPTDGADGFCGELCSSGLLAGSSAEPLVAQKELKFS